MKTVTKIEPQQPVLKPRKRVAAYARVSMETERLQHSLSAQISYYNDKIQKNPDWLFVGSMWMTAYPVRARQRGRTSIA